MPTDGSLAFDTALGMFGIRAEAGVITQLYFPGYVPDDLGDMQGAPDVLRKAREEILEYIAGERTRFTLPLKPRGGAFMLKVWDRLIGIGYGEVLTYGRVAQDVGSPGAARAVGAACRDHPIPLLIPCHRVIGANGKLTGFSGGGLGMKSRLLSLEAGKTGLFGLRENGVVS